jgi:beta-lactam-binding protein with PASTA domain
MPDELNEVRPGDRITADLVNTLIRRVKAPSTGGEGTITVPALFGLPLPSARDTVLNVGLAVGKVVDAYGRELDSTQPTPQAPVVISQIPTPGIRVNANHVVLIAVSAQATTGGPQPAPGPAIPDLVHKTLIEAQTLLAQRGIQSDQIDVLDVFGRSLEANDPDRNNRRIISQVPVPETPVSQTFSVKLVTTNVAGPHMPILVGLNLVNARARLAQANILAEVRALDANGGPVDPNDSRFNERLVLNQIPPPGPQTQSITGVSLVTTPDVPPPSTGPVVPNLLHLDLAVAKQRLETATIPLPRVLVRDVFGSLVDANDSQNNDRLILNQLPVPGTPVSENLSMNLVATGRLPASTPPPDGGGGTPPPIPHAPLIFTIYPSNVPVDTEIRIVGENFSSNPLMNAVTIDGIQVIPSPESTTTTLLVVVPRSLANGLPSGGSSKEVRVRTVAGESNFSITVMHTSSGILPQITAIHPPTGVMGQPFTVHTNIGSYSETNGSSGARVSLDGLAPPEDGSYEGWTIPDTIPGVDPGTSKSVLARIRYNDRTSPAFAYSVMRPLSIAPSEPATTSESTAPSEPATTSESTAPSEPATTSEPTGDSSS